MQSLDGVHSWSVGEFREAAAAEEGGLWEIARAIAMPPVKQVDVDRLPWLAATLSKSLSQSYGDARHPAPHGLGYSTSQRDNGMAFDISVWGEGRLWRQG